MASQGPRSPTVAGIAGGAGATWTTPNNVFSSDSAYATTNPAAGATSDYLYACGFGFTIPAGVTIAGIQVDIERSESNADDEIFDFGLFLSKNAPVSVGGDNKADTVTEWPTVKAYKTYGGDGQLWNMVGGLSVAEVNNANFGLNFKVQAKAGAVTPLAQVDHVRMTIYYNDQVGGWGQPI